jgi:hypothetical protein
MIIIRILRIMIMIMIVTIVHDIDIYMFDYVCMYPII